MDIKGRKIDLPSGAVMYANPAKYEETEEFLGAFLESVSGLPSPANSENEEYLKTFSEIVISKAFINSKLKACVWKCLTYCLYVPKDKTTPLKINSVLFDLDGDRQDLVHVFYECAQENFSPFFLALWNRSKTLQSQIKGILK